MTTLEQTTLPRSGLQLTRLGLGTAPLGGLYEAVTDDEAQETIDAAYEELGVRLFDTAPLYGFGLAEERAGRGLRDRPRDYVLCTKVGRLLREDAPPDPTQQHDGLPFYRGAPSLNPRIDFSASAVEQSLTESRARLGIDELDVVYIHDPELDPDTALDAAYPALAAMRASSEIRAVGVGSCDVDVLVQFARTTACDCFLVAGRYTLLDVSALERLLPLCQEREIGVVAGGVFNSGILAQPEAGARFDYIPASDAVLHRARALEDVCSRFDVPLMAAALQFTAAHPAVAAVVVGARSATEIRQCAEMYALEIPGDLWLELQRNALIPTDAPVPPG